MAVDGQPVALDADGRAWIETDAPGKLPVEATAVDLDGLTGRVSTWLKVRDPSDTTPPELVLSYGPSAVVTQQLEVTGTVSDVNLDGWLLELAPLRSDDFLELAGGATPVADQVLARLDTGQLANGLYRLRLSAADIGGRKARSEAQIEINSTSKPGAYQRTVTDLSVSLGGETVQLTRVYDSLQQSAAGSFGPGWHLALRDVHLQTDVDTPAGDVASDFLPFREGTRLYLTLPDGQRAGFTFHPARRTRASMLTGRRGRPMRVCLPVGIDSCDADSGPAIGTTTDLRTALPSGQSGVRGPGLCVDRARWHAVWHRDQHGHRAVDHSQRQTVLDQ